ncbi:MAG TPA: hypothetical protein VK787_14040, partial [Puia sp.]|nr:hypothetical protein [Puia sp.]
LGVLLIIVCCSSFKIKDSTNKISQGIEGHVYFISGNQMPSPGRKPSSPKGIKTTLYIYQLTNINQVTRQGQSVFYSAVITKLITKVESDTTGYFKVQLEPGSYSLFTKKGALFYASIFDKDNNIAPVQVLAGKITKAEVRIDYDATY